MTMNFDRLTIVALLATAALPFAAFSPVKAATVQECAAQAADVRAQAVSAEPKAAAKALRTVALAERLCAEGGRLEAGKKLTLAMKQLGTTVELADRR